MIILTFDVSYYIITCRSFEDTEWMIE